MATLTSGISASDPMILVTTPGDSYVGLRFRIDDELMELSGFDVKPLVGGYRPSGLDRTRWFVNRGLGESVAASHDAGATLKAAVSASVSSDTLTAPSPFASGGGEQTVRLYEFAFDYDDSFVNDDYAVFATVPNDGYIVYSACIISVNWTGTAANGTSFEVVRRSGGTEKPFLEYTDVGTASVVSPGEVLSILNFRAVLPISAGDQLAIGVWPDAGSLDSGSAKAIVLVAEPA